MVPKFDLAGTCPNANSTLRICLPVHVSLTADSGLGSRTAVQIYVSQPSTSQNVRPSLVFGGFSFVTCRDSSGLTSQCNSANDIDTTISSLDVGEWSSSANAFQFLSGCYSFIVANDEASASQILNTTSSAPNQIVHATAPFSAATTLSSGKCPG